ncbi:hypothetical protein [Occallatibacter savannae]|uniref:hypothetical protein n=1 Tax=Occallatibacter savannae TaxID=1002691 RepID=UPI000D68ED36|nr:hypothetical protein [Occallatibacter savannae]
MKHLSEEEQIEMYYGDGSEEARKHLKVCQECAAEFAKFKRSLDAIKSEDVPQRGPDYGDFVWQALRPQLIPYEKKTTGWHGWSWWKLATAAAACLALMTAAFIGGRLWEHRSAGPNDVAGGTNAGNAQPQQRVVLVVLTDHLDRTERLLVQLNHADLRDRSESAQLQTEARELLASNRLYRVSANKEGDPALAGALDRLEGVLAEIANDPHLTAADLERVRKDMNTSGILFEVRVLLTRKPNEEGGPKPAKGVSI